MEPGNGFWEGVGRAVGGSPGWMVVGTVLAIGTLFIVAKYIWPSHERIKMRELDIRQREADNDCARIESNKAIAEQTRSMRASVDALAKEQAAQTARLDESAAGSHEMGGAVRRIDSATASTNRMVTDIHKHLIGGEGTD